MSVTSSCLGALCHTPHALLGIHPTPESALIRLYRPGASHLFIELYGYVVEMQKVGEEGFFELSVPKDLRPIDYKVFHTSGLKAHDPYAFWPTLGEVDQYLFGKGCHYDLHKKMGAKPLLHQGVKGVAFTLWAPSAKRVSVVGDFNHWDGRVNPMRSLGASGIYEIFVPGLEVGAAYKFEVIGADNQLRIKADPFAHAFEVRPKTASIVVDCDEYVWRDHCWIDQRKRKSINEPINIYEVHLGSWKRGMQGEFLSYRTLAHELAAYCHDMGYTHVELMPPTEHPLDESWGYQVTGFFAPTSRFGTLHDFQYFVDTLHLHNIGVIIDWVPGHFPTDDFALARFDGTALYEHEDPRQGFHPHWSTHIFNFGRNEVSNFLISSALFWLDALHIDGLRVDAVASMLYLDYGRENGEWIPNCYGGKENLEAVEFLKHANSTIHRLFPGVLTIAEESTAFPGISHLLDHGGLGFDLKWNMGWMNDTLRYMAKTPIHRKHHQHDLTFSLLYAFTERFVLVLSHDEVVHGKNSLLGRMQGAMHGDMWQQFANARLLIGYMMTQPGKKLLFMGGEIGQWNEWNCKRSIEWFLLQFPNHMGLQNFVRELNHFYLGHSELWADDFSYRGFSWVDFSDANNSVLAFLRRDPNKDCHHALLCVLHFTPQYFPCYSLPLHNVRNIVEILNSDDERFGGSGKVKGHIDVHAHTIAIQLAPLACQLFEVEFL